MSASEALSCMRGSSLRAGWGIKLYEVVKVNGQLSFTSLTLTCESTELKIETMTILIFRVLTYYRYSTISTWDELSIYNNLENFVNFWLTSRKAPNN